MSLDLGVDTTPAGSGSADAPVPITSERAGRLLEIIRAAYSELGFDEVPGMIRCF